MKTLAIIGASYLQRPLVEKAHAMGLRTLCFAWADGAVCRDLCDRFYDISIVEKEQILKVCQEEQIDGICTIASDVAAPTVAYVAGQMGLVGNDPEAALRANNKYQMREAFMQAGVPCPRYQMLVKGTKLKVEGMVLPVIVKPSDRSGSLGVTKVERWEDLEPAIERAWKCSFKKEAMVEEFIEGREISVEFISYQGQHYPLQITDKITTEAPHFVELEHHQPSTLSEKQYEEIYSITRRALDALGLSCGASHSEYKITQEGRIAVMEIGGRMGGDFIGSNLVQLSTGYDFVRGVIEVALGEFQEPQLTCHKHAGVYFLSSLTPYVKHYIDHHEDYPQIVQYEQTDPELHNPTCSAERSGYVLYQADEKWNISLRGRTVMILGGGRYQLPLIQSAKAAGCRTLVLGWPGNFPGYALADKWYNVDIMDAEAVIEIGRQEKADGIVGCGSDFILPTIGKVVDALGLPGACYQSSVVASNKLLMKQAFEKTQVRTAAYREARSEQECVRAAQEVGYPAVVKIVDGSGSKGVVIVQNEAQLRQAYADVQRLTKEPYVVVEEFVDGLEFGAQAYVQNGKLQFVMPHGDLVFHGASGVPVGHYAPYEEAVPMQADIEEQLRRCIQALGIDNCAINADFILHEGKTYVLEIGARAGATCLPELVSVCYGLDYYNYLLRGACGLPLPDMHPTQLNPGLVFTVFSTQTGIVETKETPTLPGLVDFCLYPEPGEEIHAFRTAYDRIGHLVMTGSSMSELMQTYHEKIEGNSFCQLKK